MIGVEYTLRRMCIECTHRSSASLLLVVVHAGLSPRWLHKDALTPRRLHLQWCMDTGTVTSPNTSRHCGTPPPHPQRRSSWLWVGVIPLAAERWLCCVWLRGITNTMEGNLPPMSPLDLIPAVLSPPVLLHTCCGISQGKQKTSFKLKLHFWRSKPPEVKNLEAFENPSRYRLGLLGIKTLLEILH